jgi:hypothetical protein
MINARIRATLALFLLVSLSACTGRGIDAGEKGGVAFIAMAGMLIVTAFLMWFFLGRND